VSSARGSASKANVAAREVQNQAGYTRTPPLLIGDPIGDDSADGPRRCKSGTADFRARTNGIDGPTDAAGAIADECTLARARALGLDARRFLADNDSYHFFEKLEALVKTGPTGTNVMDVRAILVLGCE
jgi:MOFRL family